MWCLYLSENVKISIEFRISGCKETELVSRRQQKDKAIKKKKWRASQVKTCHPGNPAKEGLLQKWWTQTLLNTK